MKKVFTILFAFGFTAAIAQSHQPGNNSKQPQREYRNDDHANDDNRKFDNAYVFTSREKDNQIAKINWDYNARVRAIQSNCFLKNRQKRNQVDQLEFERSQMIRDVIAKFNDKRNRSNRTYAYDRRRF